MFWTALPTPWASGVTDSPDKVTIGAARINIFSEPDAKLQYAEFGGQGLGVIQTAMEKKERQMAALGSRLMDDQKAGVEAAEAIRLRLQGDSATLGGIALTASMAWTKLLQWVWDWQHPMVEADPAIEVELNTDFSPAKLQPQELTALQSALASNYIDLQTWFYQLQKGEIVPPGLTLDEMVQNILEGSLIQGMATETQTMLEAQLREAGAVPRLQPVPDGDEDQGAAE
jgi:hypothetical protein